MVWIKDVPKFLLVPKWPNMFHIPPENLQMESVAIITNITSNAHIRCLGCSCILGLVDTTRRRATNDPRAG
eukprot:10073919-Karenia_brevis.AAC.1